MSDTLGDGNAGVADEGGRHEENVLCSQTRDAEMRRGGEGRGRIAPNTAEVESMDISELSEPRTAREQAKRKFREFLKEIPNKDGEKGVRWVGGRILNVRKAYVTVEGLQKLFQDVTDRETLALYTYSAAYMPLLQTRHSTTERCKQCNKGHVIGGQHFKPYYTYR